MILKVNKSTYYDAINLYQKNYYPINEFCSNKDFEQIIDKKIDSRGNAFGYPIILSISSKEKSKLVGKIIYLKFRKKVYFKIKVKNIYKISKKKYLKKIFETDHKEHPGVKNFLRLKKFFVCGKPVLIDSLPKKYQKTSSEYSKKLININKIKKISAFHTRNVPHKIHEWIINLALKKCNAVLISPMIGMLKKSDTKKEKVLKAYKLLISKKYKKKKIFLIPFYSQAKYAGPREAINHCIVRKNLGCTHITIGRDHAGVGNFYKKYSSQKACKKLEKKMKIKIITYWEPIYSKKKNKIISIKNFNKKDFVKISGAKIRSLIKKRKKVPRYMIDDDTLRILKRN